LLIQLLLITYYLFTYYLLLIMFTDSTPILQYTPPTCTLEIWVKSSPFSSKNKQKHRDDISFELRFDDPRLPEEQQVTIKGDRNQLEALCDVVCTYVQYLLKQPATAFSLVEKAPTETPKESNIDSIPYLKTQGLFIHELSLGFLKNEKSGETFKLSATQLFDLANALENYRDEIASLPVLKPKISPQFFILWGSIAATLLLALGLNTGVIKILPQFQQMAEKGTTSDEKLSPVPGADVQPPSPLPPVNIPSPTVPLPLRNIQRLPPPTPVQEPGVGRYNNAPNSGIVVIKPPGNQPNFPIDTNSNTGKNLGNAERRDQGAIAFRSPGNFTPNIPPPPPLKPSRSPSVRVEPRGTLPPPNSAAAENRQQTTPLPTFSDGANPNFSTDNIPKERLAKTSDLPQLSEVKTYFKQRWQPPENLKQTLEYRLSIDRNGSLNKITPIGQASGINLDKTGMPLLGESFVSPLTNREKATIRLVLNPDGTVQTFAEWVP
jgi:hypothetical protein